MTLGWCLCSCPWVWCPHRSLLGRCALSPSRAGLCGGLIRALSVPLQAATPCAPAVNYELVSAPHPAWSRPRTPRAGAFWGEGWHGP